MKKELAVDLSHHNAVASFHDAYKSGIRLVIHKATQGLSFVDDEFAPRRNRLETYLPEMLFGAYHFGTAGDPLRQAEHLMNVASGVKLLVLDWEPNPNGGDMSVAEAEAFVSRIRQVTGRFPLLYSGHTLKAARLKASSPLIKCELWLAQYGPKAVVPKAWEKRGYRLWQFTSSGSVPGIGGSVDVNRFPGTPDDLERWYAAL